MRDLLLRKIERWLFSYPAWKEWYKAKLEFYLTLSLSGGQGFICVRGEGGHGTPVERAALRMAMDKRLAELKVKIDLIESGLKLLSPLERKFVELRYFQKFPFREVAKRMNISRATCWRYRRRVLEAFRDFLENRDTI